MIELTEVIAFVLLALYSCVFAYRRLTRPGMSSEVRYVFIRKHIFYVGVFIILWTFSLAHSYFQVFYAAQDLDRLPPHERDSRLAQYESINLTLMKITIYTSMLTGFIMSIIRAREPYFRFLIRQQWCSFFGIDLDENDKQTSAQYVNDSLATFLTSSLNVELVHVILEAITKHTKSYVDPTHNHTNFKNETLHKEKSQFTIDTIMIKNPDKWKVAKLP